MLGHHCRRFPEPHATDGTLGGITGKWSACWPVVQLDHDEEKGRCMYGTLDAELEVQRTTIRAALTAFFFFLRKAVGHTGGGVEHVKAHRSKKEMQQVSLCEKFVTEGNEKADAPAKEGARLDRGDMVQARASTVQESRAALHYAAGFHCLVEEWKDCEELEPKPQEKCVFMNKKGETKKHGTEWCAAANTAV